VRATSRLSATIVGALAFASFVAAAPSDSAVIVNSGSTNSYGYTIVVSPDGKGSITMQAGGGSTQTTTPKPFSVSATAAARFFSDLAAARKAKTTTAACMKSASFGTSVHVTWQGWKSPDLTCPPNDSLGDALVKDVAAIRQAAGISELPLRNAGARPAPAPTESPR
jgi:hypothetical protein